MPPAGRGAAAFGGAAWSWRAAIVVCCLLAAHAYAKPIQYLPDIPGYIPVYIRLGDQPLEEISPVLAEAFHEPVIKSYREVRQEDAPTTEAKKEATPTTEAAAPKNDSTELADIEDEEKLAVTLPNTTSEAPTSTTTEKETFIMRIPPPKKSKREVKDDQLERR